MVRFMIAAFALICASAFVCASADAAYVPPSEATLKGDEALEQGNYPMALQWYRAAANRGDGSATAKLGWLYREGLGVTRDFAQARQWFQMAADLGVTSGEFGLGTLYESGVGVEQDYQEAARWYRLAADKGNAKAQNNLAWLFQNGKGVPVDLGEAVRWYKLAAAQGMAEAQGNLGAMLYNGQGVARDLKEAEKLLRAAAGQGNKGAQSYVDKIDAERKKVAQAAAQAAAQKREASAARVTAAGGSTRMAIINLPDDEPSGPSAVGSWRSREPVVEQGLRRMFLRMNVSSHAVQFHFDCQYLDGAMLTGSFSTRAELSKQEIRILEPGQGKSEQDDKSCVAGIQPTSLPFSISGGDMSLTFRGKRVSMRRQ